MGRRGEQEATTMEFQIRDESFGLALREAETAEGALLAFLADKLAADGVIAADTVATDDGGVAFAYCRGHRYMAVPCRASAGAS